MNSHKLEELAKLVSPPQFLGVFKVDNLSKIHAVNLNNFHIILYHNNHYSLFIKNYFWCGYFDSLRQFTLFENEAFLSFLAANCSGKVSINMFKTQNSFTLTCGYHVLYFIYLLFITGENFDTICKKYFSRNTGLNERRILRFHKWITYISRKPQAIYGLRRSLVEHGPSPNRLHLKDRF